VKTFGKLTGIFPMQLISIYCVLQNDLLNNVKFNTSSRCMPPLVATSMVSSWYPNVDGCGLQCRNPMLSDDEHNSAHKFVAIIGSVSLLCTLFTVVGAL
jgi:hypothetical protein